jgi:hypothetical protein
MPSAQHLHSEEVADLLLKEWGRGRRMDEWLSTAVLLGTIWAIKIDRPLDKPTSARHFDAAVPSRLIALAAKRHQDHLLEPRPVAQLGRITLRRAVPGPIRRITPTIAELAVLIVDIFASLW